MPKPRVTIVCGNLSSNGITRGILLMRAMEEHVNLALLGFASPTMGLHHSLKGWEDRIVIHREDTVAGVVGRGAMRRLVDLIRKDGKTDIVLALKPRPGSLDVAVRAAGPERVILDVDDDEMAFHRQRPAWVRAYKTLLGLPSVFGVHRLAAMERMAGQVADVWCASETLQKRFGGRLIPHPVDPTMFQAAAPGRDTMRQWLSVQNKVVVIFSGTLREHKGFPLLAQAVAKTKHPDLVLAVLGTSKDETLLMPFRTLLGDRLLCFGRVSAEKVPDYLCASDIVALPTLDRPSAAAQIPIKLVEAMMSGLAIVTSQPGDGGKLVEGGAGIKVPPMNPEALAAELDRLAGDAALRQQLGKAAQEKVMSIHALPVVREKILESVFEVYHKIQRGRA